MENLNSPNSGPAQPAPQQPQEKPGFIMLLKASFQVFTKNWTHFLRLTLILALPFILIGGLLFMVAGSKAAPKVPGAEPIVSETIEESAGADAEERTIGDIIETIEASQEEGVVEATEKSLEEDLAIDDLGESRLIDEAGLVVGDDSIDAMELGVNTSISKSAFLTGILAMMAGMMVILAILAIPLMLYYLMAILAMVRLAVLASQNQEIHLGEIIKWSFTKLFSYIWLSIIIGFYLGWPFMATVVLLGVFQAIGLGNSTTILSFIMGAAALIYFIVVFPRVMFAQYALAELSTTAKEAFSASVSAAKGHWGKIVGYVLLFGILTAVASGIVTYSLKWTHEVGYILNTLLSIFFSYISVIFYYGLYSLCKIENESKT